MTYIVKISAIAQIELDDAIDYYEYVSTGLGHSLKDEIDSAVKRISNFPYISEVVSRRVRRHLVNRFSYSVFYSVDENAKEIQILAIGHQHREPSFWHGRESHKN